VGTFLRHSVDTTAANNVGRPSKDIP